MTMSSSIAFVCEFHVLLLLTPHLPGEGFKILSESLPSFPPSLLTFFTPSSLPSANTELQIAVGTVGLQWRTARHQPRAPDHSGHLRTSTAGIRARWDPRLRLGPCQSEGMSEQMPDWMPEQMLGRVAEWMRDRMAEKNVRIDGI